MTEETAVLTNYEKYGFSQPVFGIVEPSSTFDPKNRLLGFGNGVWIDVKLKDLIVVDTSEKQQDKIFPL